MSKQTINVGNTPNDRKGDSLRSAFLKVNANFTELYTTLGLDELPLNLGAFEFSESVNGVSTISTTDSSAIVIDQATTVTSDLTVGGDVVPSIANGGDLGSLAKPWRSLYVSSSTVYFGGVPLSLDENNNLLVNGLAIADVGTAAWANITGKPTFAEVATSGSYADLSNKPTIPTAVSQLTNDSGFITSADIAGGTLTVDVNNTGDLKGSVFGDDSTLLVDATNSKIVGDIEKNGILTLRTTDNDMRFYAADDFYFAAGEGASDFVVNAGLIELDGDVELDGTLTFPDATVQTTAYTGYHTGDVTGSVFADDSTLLVDGVAGKIVGPYDNGVVSINPTNVTTYDLFVQQDANTHDLYVANRISGGATGSIKNVAIASTAPSTSIGASGDLQGMVAFDGTYMYYCTANYDGGTNIWKRVAWSGDTWT